MPKPGFGPSYVARVFFDAGCKMISFRTSAFVSVTLSAVAVSVILPILGPLSRVLHLSEIQIGTIVSAGSAVMAVAGLLWGRLSDRIGRQPIMMIGFLGLGLSYAVYTWLTWLGLKGSLVAGGLFMALLLSRAVVGIFLPAVPAAAQALVADNTSEVERSAGMALIGAANGLGMVIGPVLGGVLALKGLIWPLFVTTIVSLLAFLFVALKVPRARPVLRGPVPRLDPLRNGMWRWLIGAFMTFLAIITMQIAAAFYIQDSLAITEEQTAPILAIALFCVGIVMILTQVLQMKVLKWAPRPLVLIGAGLWIAGLVMLLILQSPMAYYASYFVLGVGNGLIFPGMMAGASLCADAHHQGGVAGLIAAVQGTAAILAPIGSTTLYHFRPELPFLLAMAGMALVIVLFAATRTAALRPAENAAE